MQHELRAAARIAAAEPLGELAHQLSESGRVCVPPRRWGSPHQRDPCGRRYLL